MQQSLARAERALRLHQEAAPFLDANAIGRLRRDCLIQARRSGADAKPWRGSVRKGATISGLRGVLADLKTERASVEAAPPPLADELDRLFAEIDAAAARGMPKAAIVTDDVYGNRHPMGRMKLRSATQINWPTIAIDADRSSGSHEPLMVVDAASMISWLFGDQIKSALKEQLTAAYRQFDGAVLTEAQRRIELKRIASDARCADLHRDAGHPPILKEDKTMLNNAILPPDIDAWPKRMKRLWTVEQIMEMPRERTEELREQKRATGAPTHFFPGTRCECCGYVAPKLVSSGSCVIRVHRKNESDRIRDAYSRGKGGNESTKRRGKLSKTIGFRYGTMRGGGCGNRLLIPTAKDGWKIDRPDDAKRNEDIRRRARARSRPGAVCVTGHMAHSGWPLAPGVYVIGLETWENLVPMPQSINRGQGNRLHDPADPAKVTERVFSLDEQHDQFVKPRRAIFAWDIIWQDGIIGGTATGVRKERYAFGPDGLVAYDADVDIEAEAKAWDRAMVRLDLEAFEAAGRDVKLAARARGIKPALMRARLIEAGSLK